MRKPQYLSPTSLALFYDNQEEFFLNYISDNRPERMPQNQAMSIGSAFDAYVKNYLHEALFGKGYDEKFDLRALFDAQVEPHNRDWAWQHGQYVFNQYKSSGALADLMAEMQGASSEPRFEFSAMGVLNGYREGKEGVIGSVPFLGKPDAAFVTAHGAHVILDFKVNGYCSKNGASPLSGYLKLRSANSTNFGQHRNTHPMMDKGMVINVGCYLEDLQKKWAEQLAIYGWLCGEPVGSDFIVAIDQIVCNPSPGLPSIKVAEHRLKVSQGYQNKVFERACYAWEVIHSDWFFRDMSKEESMARCELLNAEIVSDTDNWFDGMRAR